ncbi:hypothetical protein HMPREF9123_0287 [Neisseria bacilliformis ATCC BAA-1200]|uniref:Uncharacterized protein n=1 Tax=Neisseria bacilliformis ATCC BAA-1200 TaxID=888742 RepID=F2B942_9NEIS|nr:hypothetical protein HMPREF9123_0287 [Neisseria bacilliformis ATCC BAA-1200]
MFQTASCFPHEQPFLHINRVRGLRHTLPERQRPSEKPKWYFQTACFCYGNGGADVGCVAPRRTRFRYRHKRILFFQTASHFLAATRRWRAQTACVAAPHTLPWRYRPSEKHLG